MVKRSFMKFRHLPQYSVNSPLSFNKFGVSCFSCLFQAAFHLDCLEHALIAVAKHTTSGAGKDVSNQSYRVPHPTRTKRSCESTVHTTRYGRMQLGATILQVLMLEYNQADKRWSLGFPLICHRACICFNPGKQGIGRMRKRKASSTTKFHPSSWRRSCKASCQRLQESKALKAAAQQMLSCLGSLQVHKAYSACMILYVAIKHHIQVCGCWTSCLW